MPSFSELFNSGATFTELQQDPRIQRFVDLKEQEGSKGLLDDRLHYGKEGIAAFIEDQDRIESYDPNRLEGRGGDFFGLAVLLATLDDHIHGTPAIEVVKGGYRLRFTSVDSPFSVDARIYVDRPPASLWWQYGVPKGNLRSLITGTQDLHMIMAKLADWQMATNLWEQLMEGENTDELLFYFSKTIGHFRYGANCEEARDRFANEKPTLTSLLDFVAETFPNSDPDEVVQHLPSDRAVLSSIRKTCDGTYSEIVADYILDGVHYFIKIGEKGPINDQWKADRIAWLDKYPNWLLRPVTPRPVSHNDQTPNIASLVSISTAQEGIPHEDVLVMYSRFREDVFSELATEYRHLNLKVNEMVKDPYLNDRFNLTLFQVIMSVYQGEFDFSHFPVLKQPLAFASMFEQARNMGTLTEEQQHKLLEHLAWYEHSFPKLSSYGDRGVVGVVHGDPKITNIVTFPPSLAKQGYHIRSLGDSAQSGVAYNPELEVAKMTSPNGQYDLYADLFLSLKKIVGRRLNPRVNWEYLENTDLISQASSLLPVNLLRFSLFDASRGKRNSPYLNTLLS